MVTLPTCSCVISTQATFCSLPPARMLYLTRVYHRVVETNIHLQSTRGVCIIVNLFLSKSKHTFYLTLERATEACSKRSTKCVNALLFTSWPQHLVLYVLVTDNFISK